jgi:1-acyl-sn-glycerol-3-phosphate acyltransferase
LRSWSVVEISRLGRATDRPKMTILDGYDHAYATRVARILGPLTRAYFRFRLRGAEHVPPGPVMVVANHSALGTAELLCFLGAWRNVFGTRPARGLMMDLFLRLPGMASFWRKVGAIPASPANGRAALAAGMDVLVFPGGDIDTCRPFHEPREVHFGERRGYARLALETGAKIVPLATIGSHWTWLMAPGGGALARLLGTKKRARIERFPLPLNAFAIALLFVLTLAGVLPVWLDAVLVVLAILPTPARITSELLVAIDPRAATAHLQREEDRVAEVHRLVYGALSLAVRTMRHDEPLLLKALVSRRGPDHSAGRCGSPSSASPS